MKANKYYKDLHEIPIKNWYDLQQEGHLDTLYDDICQAWKLYRESPNFQDLNTLLGFWSTPEAITHINTKGVLPKVGEWAPR